MKVNLLVLDKALDKLKYAGYGEDVQHSIEVSLQHEDLEGGKLGDVMILKQTFTKINKYNNGQEEVITRIVEIPGDAEGLGHKFNYTTQTTETYDLKKEK